MSQKVLLMENVMEIQFIRVIDSVGEYTVVDKQSLLLKMEI